MTPLSWVLRASIIIATLAVIGAALMTPDASPIALSWFVAVAAVACAVGAAVMPDGHAPTAVIALLLVYWVQVVDNDVHVLTLVAAVGLVTVHTASSIEAITPPGSRLVSATYRLWTIRVLAIIVATCVLWLVAVGADRVEHDGGLVLVVLFGLLAGAAIWVMRLRALGRV